MNITTNLKDQFRDSVPNPRDKKKGVVDRSDVFQFYLISCSSRFLWFQVVAVLVLVLV